MGAISLPVAAQDVTATEENEARQIRFAEHLIVTEMAQGLSHSVRKTREECAASQIAEKFCFSVPTSWGTELAIGLIGIGRSDATADALVNLLGQHFKQDELLPHDVHKKHY
jgi:hypothetical protein